MQMNRRNFIKASAGAAIAAGALGLPYIARATGTPAKIVIVGGGTGGATAAKYLRIMDPSLEVTIVEKNPTYHTCFLSNEVLSGDRTLESLEFGYDGLKKHGVTVVQGEVTGIDEKAKQIKLADGKTLPYDRAIVSPGVSFKYEEVEGYDESMIEKIPHAWKAGPQTTILRKQLEEMKDGGVVIIVPPVDPFRCPPGPYERACQIAMYLKDHKPKSKILILDPKEKFSKFGLFTQAWKELYGYGTDNSLIEWMPPSKQGKLVRVDAATMTLVAGDMEDEHKGDVINIIPPQKAGQVAFAMGLTEGDWCPVNKQTFESTKVPGVYVIGDAAIATEMPKSAYAANSQAKVCAAAIVAALSGKEMVDPSYVNTCYSVLGKDYGISVAAVYRYNKEENVIASVKDSGGLSPENATPAQRKREVEYAYSWFKNITADMFS